MTDTNNYTANKAIIRNLMSQKLKLADLNSYIKIKYQDYREAGQKANISGSRVKQILLGYKLPKSAKLIRHLARSWEIDEIKLTQLLRGGLDG